MEKNNTISKILEIEKHPFESVEKMNHFSKPKKTKIKK